MKKMLEWPRVNLCLTGAALLLMSVYAATDASATEGCGTYYQDACTEEYGESYRNDEDKLCTFSTCEVSWQNGGPHVDCKYTCFED